MQIAETSTIPTQSKTLREFIFCRGLAGFPKAHRFAFIYEGHGNLLCLQSLDSPEASFILTPWDEARLGETPDLSEEQLSCLKAREADEIMWMAVLNPFADPQWVTANQRAPIAICEAQQTGLQCIRSDKHLQLRFPWIKQPKP